MSFVTKLCWWKYFQATNEMFNWEMSLKYWVYNSISTKITIVDAVYNMNKN
jgi:hypothetical protein